MREIDRYITVTEAKDKLLDLVRELAGTGEVVGITRNGTPAAVLLSADRWQGLAEMLDILADPKTMAALRRALRQAAAGKLLTDRQVFGR